MLGRDKGRSRSDIDVGGLGAAGRTLASLARVGCRLGVDGLRTAGRVGDGGYGDAFLDSAGLADSCGACYGGTFWLDKDCLGQR